MKGLYVLLLYLPSTFGRLSQMAIGYPCTRVTIPLDDSYAYFYAFSRLRAKTPPIFGYVEGKRVYYTPGGDVPIQTKIFWVPVTGEECAQTATYMDEVKRDGEIMYNLSNVLLIPVFGGHPVYRVFHYEGSIAEVLEQAGMEPEKPCYQYTPGPFAKLLGEYEIFEGVLESDLNRGMEDDFFREVPRGKYLGKTCYVIQELLYRQMFHRASPGFRPEAVRFVVEDGEL